MTTVLSVGNSEGERRCDARCHDARFPGCDCVCGGKYHGAGASNVVQRVGQDVLEGVFGQAMAIEGQRHLQVLRESQPQIVRFHRHAVGKALAKVHRDQARLVLETSA